MKIWTFKEDVDTYVLPCSASTSVFQKLDRIVEAARTCSHEMVDNIKDLRPNFEMQAILGSNDQDSVTILQLLSVSIRSLYTSAYAIWPGFITLTNILWHEDTNCNFRFFDFWALQIPYIQLFISHCSMADWYGSRVAHKWVFEQFHCTWPFYGVIIKHG